MVSGTRMEGISLQRRRKKHPVGKQEKKGEEMVSCILLFSLNLVSLYFNNARAESALVLINWDQNKFTIF